MNASTPKLTRSGFTLVELLVVIAVIAILAGIAVPSVGAIFGQVKKMESTSMAVSLVNAIERLENDRSYLPSAWTETPQDTDNAVLSHLMGVTAVNRDGTDYLDMTPQTTIGGGLYQTGTGADATYELYDAWVDDPKMFKLVVDQDEDEEIARPAGFDGAGTVPIRKIAIVYSAGSDRDYATGKDNPNSWGD